MKLANGFSLIELCITIALFALIATITFPSIWFLRRQQVVSEVDKLFSVFSYLQQAAIASNKDLVLQFDSQNNSYSFESSKIKLSEQTKFSIKQDLKGPPSSPVNTLTKPITFMNNQVVFYADGKMQPGTVYLTDSKKHYLYAITIPISQVSLIRKYKYINKWILYE
ncbi:MAG: prepilin-type N-terminal cleavage/methylation domain-containing protein [Candidatus Babeliales bacterium]|nr:prepilin-type N-terminal cleavage/methylation domain-containing protein [Candidatus Babeliales bacterium]